MTLERDSSLPEEHTVAEALLERFHAWGITTIFAVPGAQIEALLMQVAKDDRFRLVMAAHEQGAGYMADGYARITNGPGVAMSINGPGANNFTTAAVTARVDHSPVMFLTGDVPAALLGFGGFQSSDPEGSNTGAIMRESLQHSVCITTPEVLKNALEQFENSFQSPAPTPLHINLPVDIALRPLQNWQEFSAFTPPHTADSYQAPAWLKELPPTPGSRTVILVGEEIKTNEEMEVIARLAVQFSIPVACTLAAKRGLAFVPEKLRLGVFGYAGGPRAFRGILSPELDMLIVIGALFDERNTAAWDAAFFHPGRRIFRFSSYPESLHRCPGSVTEIKMDERVKSLDSLHRYWEGQFTQFPSKHKDREDWCRELQKLPIVPTQQDYDGADTQTGIAMSSVLSTMNESLPSDTSLFLDSGDHRIFAGFHWTPGAQGSFFTSAQTGPMGWAIGAAIGASFAREEKPVWVLTGDGCMQMHGMEIAVAAKHKRRVVFLVCNNHSYGRIAARLAHEPAELRHALSSLPDISWSEFAHSLGVRSKVVTTAGELKTAIGEAMNCPGPFLIEMFTAAGENNLYPPAVFSSSTPGFVKKWKERPEDESAIREEQR